MTKEESGAGMRGSARFPIKAKVQFAWTDTDGAERSCLGECCDISETGMSVASSEQIPSRAYVRFRAQAIRLEGSGSVRYCVRHKLKSESESVEFSGVLAWKPEDVGTLKSEANCVEAVQCGNPLLLDVRYDEKACY